MTVLSSFVLLLRIWLSLYRGGYPEGTLHKFGAQELTECDNVECITLESQMPRLEGRAVLLFARASCGAVHENTNGQDGIAKGDTVLRASFSSTFRGSWAFLFSPSTKCRTTEAFIDDLCIK